MPPLVINPTVIPVIEKHPDSILFYGWEWIDFLTPPAQIQTSTWIIPPGITKDSETNDGDSTRVRISGGTLGTEYLVTNRIVTNEAIPQTEHRSFKLKIKIL